MPGPNNTTVNVPMGILHTAIGGTRIDPWLETNEAAAFPEFAAGVNGSPANATTGTPSAIYNQMIAPLAQFRVKGAVWYQGETSSDRPDQYSRLMRGWRRVFGQPNLPFVIVELPNYSTKGSAAVESGSWAELREAQFKSVVNDPYSRLAITIDIGEQDIHPRDKQDVGLRVASAARDVAYGETLVSQGPLFTGATVEGSTLRCAFSNVGAGLMVGAKVAMPNNPATPVAGGTLTGFAIAGSDKNFVAATALIDAATNTVVVSAPSVTAPLYVRYAWANNPTCNLYNKITDAGGNVVDGLPASPFRNDPVFLLNVVNGSGTGYYAVAATPGITAVSVSGLTFSYWSGDTALLARPDRSPTTATITLPYQTFGSNYQLNTAPTGLSATAGSQQVALTWTALNNAIAYSIKRATASGGPYVTLVTGLQTTSYTDLAAGFNTTNYYVVSASNAVGESPNSAPVTGVGQPPAAPANFIDGSLATKWYGVQATVTPGNPVFLAYQFAGGAAWKVSSYQLATADDAQPRDPRDWLFQGSNDGVAWTTLDSRTNQTLGSARNAYTPAYTVSNPAAYRNYRLLVTAVLNAASGNGCQLSELALFSSPTDAGDKTPPVLTVPANIVTDATGPGGAVVNFTVTATDAVSGTETPVVQPPSGSAFPAGTTTVQCQATDDASNTATASFTVTVRGMVADNDLVGFSVVQNGTSVRITRPTSVAGRTYQLQRRLMLETGTWSDLGSPQTGGGTLDFSDPNPPQPQAFYRLVIGP